MGKVFVGSVTAAAIFVGGGSAWKAIESNDQPDKAVSVYTGIPLPFGDKISRATNSRLTVEVIGHGTAQTTLTALGHEALSGTVRCHDGTVELTATATAAPSWVHGAHTSTVDAAHSICNGDSLATQALQSSALPRYVLNHVVDIPAMTKAAGF